jgi:H/ACA ribonucleoprotein complex subunit 3
MARHILFCKRCNKYTMNDICSICSEKTETTKPAKYSPDDKYADLKRKAKHEMYEEKGLI